MVTYIGDEEVALDPDVEKVWEEFWQVIVAPNGVLDVEQVKRELSDYTMVMRTAAIVYDNITGGRISKVNTNSEAILGEYNNIVDEIVRDYLADETEELRERAERLRQRIVGAYSPEHSITLTERLERLQPGDLADDLIPKKGTSDAAA